MYPSFSAILASSAVPGVLTRWCSGSREGTPQRAITPDKYGNIVLAMAVSCQRGRVITASHGGSSTQGVIDIGKVVVVGETTREEFVRRIREYNPTANFGNLEYWSHFYLAVAE